VIPYIEHTNPEVRDLAISILAMAGNKTDKDELDENMSKLKENHQKAIRSKMRTLPGNAVTIHEEPSAERAVKSPASTKSSIEKRPVKSAVSRVSSSKSTRVQEKPLKAKEPTIKSPNSKKTKESSNIALKEKENQMTKKSKKDEVLYIRRF